MARPPLTCRRCNGSVPWPTSNPSVTNSWNTQLPAVISNTYASSYAVYSITPARPKSKNLRFLMVANMLSPARVFNCAHQSSWEPHLRSYQHQLAGHEFIRHVIQPRSPLGTFGVVCTNWGDTFGRMQWRPDASKTKQHCNSSALSSPVRYSDKKPLNEVNTLSLCAPSNCRRWY